MIWCTIDRLPGMKSTAVMSVFCTAPVGITKQRYTSRPIGGSAFQHVARNPVENRLLLLGGQGAGIAEVAKTGHRLPWRHGPVAEVVLGVAAPGDCGFVVGKGHRRHRASAL